MSLTREDVVKVAMLARLQFDESELGAMTTQLGSILEYVEQLSELYTDDVEPMAHATDASNVFAEDVLRPSLDRTEVLANAPKADDECFRVPAVLGE